MEYCMQAERHRRTGHAALHCSRVRAAPAELRRRGRRAPRRRARRGALRPRGQRDDDRRRREPGARAGNGSLRRARHGVAGRVGRRPRAPLGARRGAAARIREPRGDRERRARHGDGGTRVHAARAPGERLRVGDAVPRLHPRRARARPLPPLRRGRVRPRRARARSTSTARARRCAPARASTCPPGSSTASRTVGPGEMQVLGVFRPAGSPAEAYYPDGSAAVVPLAC